METREHGGIDKRLSRIDRWLKRCMAACRCGSWNSALMEIECMEAETREFREELWDIAVQEAEGRVEKPLRSRIFAGIRAVALALVMVMSIGLPLSVEQDTPFRGFGASRNSVAVLTSTESDILEALRASLSNRNADRVVLTFDRARDEEAQTMPKGAALAEDRQNRVVVSEAASRPLSSRKTRTLKSGDMNSVEGVAGAPGNTAVRQTVTKEPSVEEVISLIQVGQRALRVSEPAVKIVP